MPTGEGEVGFIPSGAAYGYPATNDPQADQTTHKLIGSSIFPMSWTDGTYTYSITSASGTLTFEVVDNATGLKSASLYLTISGSQTAVNSSATTSGSISQGTPISNAGGGNDYYEIDGNNQHFSIQLGTGSPNGVVTSIYKGGLFIDTAAPAVWQATGAAATTWVNVAGSGSSPLTTKGDLYGFDTANNRIPVGANGQVLTADSTQALGVKWAASGSTPALTNAHIFVGNGSNVATDVAMSGDATIANTGALTIANLAVTNAKIANSTIDLTAKVTGSLPVSNGGTGLGTLTAHALMLGEGTSNVAFAGPGTSAQILIAQGVSADPTFNTVSGDVTISASGVTAIGSGKVTNAMLAGSIDLTAKVTGTLPVGNGGIGVANPTAHAVLVGEGSSAVTPITVGTNGQLLIGQTSADPAFTTVSGDITINNTGVTAIGSGKVTNAMLAGSIDLTTKVTGTLPVGNGGTGIANPTAHKLIVGNGSSAMTQLAVGTTDQVLLGASAADPVFTTLTGDVTISGGATAIGSGKVTNAMLAGSIDLTTKVTGILPVANGGTGANTLTAHGVVIGNTTSAVNVTSAGTAGQVLTSNGASADPTFQANASAIFLTPTATKTTTYSAAAGELVVCDTTSGGFTVTLPTTPADGTRVGMRRLNTGGTANTINVATGGSDTFDLGGTVLAFLLPLQEIVFQYKTSTAAWYTIAGYVSVGQMDLRYMLTRTTSKTSAYNAVAGDLVVVDTTSGGVTITLPTAPSLNTTIGVKLIVKGGTNVCTVATGGSDVFENTSGATTYLITAVNQVVTFRYNTTGAIWTVVADAAVPIPRHVQIVITDPNTVVATGTNVAYFRVPSDMAGYKITAVASSVSTVSSSGLPTVTLTNATGSLAILSTALTIDASETDSSTAATPAVINTSNNQVAAADQIQVNVTVAGTGTKGLLVDLYFTPA